MRYQKFPLRRFIIRSPESTSSETKLFKYKGIRYAMLILKREDIKRYWKIILIISLIAFAKTSLIIFSSDFIGWDSEFHGYLTELLINGEKMDYLSPATLGTGGYNESPLFYYFNYLVYQIFRCNMILYFRFAVFLITFLTLLSFFFLSKEILKNEKLAILSLIIYSLISSVPTYAPSNFLIFEFLFLLFLYRFYKHENLVNSFLCGIMLGLSFLNHHEAGVYLGICFAYTILSKSIFQRDLNTLKFGIFGICISLLLASTTIIPAYINNEIYLPSSVTPLPSISSPQSGPSKVESSGVTLRLFNFIYLFGNYNSYLIFLVILGSFYSFKREKLTGYFLIVLIVLLLISSNLRFLNPNISYPRRGFSHALSLMCILGVYGLRFIDLSLKNRKLQAITFIIIFFSFFLYQVKENIVTARYEPKLDSEIKPVALYIKENWDKDYIILTDLESRYHLSFLLGNRQVYPMNLNLKDMEYYKRTNLDKEVLNILICSDEGEIKKFLEKNNIKLIVIRKNFDASNTLIVKRICAVTHSKVKDYSKIYVENTEIWKDYNFLEVIYEDEYCILYLKK